MLDRLPEIMIPGQHNTAERSFELISKLIGRVERKTPPTHFVAVTFAMNPGKPLILQSVEFINPDMLIFSGKYLDLSPAYIVQHTNQLSLAVSMIAIPDNCGVERRTIGFVSNQ